MATEVAYHHTPAAAPAAYRSQRTGAVNWRLYLSVIGSLFVGYAIFRIYMHQFAFSRGLDYFEPQFQTYWMSLFWTQITTGAVVLAGVCTYLWRTRERHPDRVAPEVELDRYFRFVAWLIAYTLVVVFTGPIQGESDASWHQVVIRDTDFTPTHIGLFYLCFPALIITGVGAFVYARTRLPQHMRAYLLPLGIAIGGPILTMPNVGFNEWGHTFFYAEELFAAPVHWGFAGLGLALLALGGVVVHLLERMGELIEEVAAKA